MGASRMGDFWTLVAGDLSTWTKSAEWSGGYPAVSNDIYIAQSTMKFDGRYLSADNGMMSKAQPAIDATSGKLLGLYVYAHRLNSNTELRLLAGTNSSNYKYYTFGRLENTLVEGWNFLAVRSDEAGAMRLLQTGSSTPGWATGAGTFDPNTQNITWLGLEVRNFRAPNYPILWVSGLYMGGGESIPMITIGFDIQTDFSTQKSILDQYGFKGYLAVGYPNESVEDSWISLYNDGWDIIPHSARHENIGTYTDREQINTELEVTRNVLRRLGLTRGLNLFASPNGSWSNKSVYVLSENGFMWHRGVTNAPICQYDHSVGHLNPLAQGAFSCGASTLTQLKARADLVLQSYKANCHFYTHGVELGGDGTNWPANTSNIYSATLDGFCAYLKQLQDSGKCRVVTPSEYLVEVSANRLPSNLHRIPDEVSINVGASPAVIENPSCRAVIMCVGGGAISSIEYSRDGTNYFPVGETGGMYQLEPGAYLRLTYSVLPTVTQIHAAA